MFAAITQNTTLLLWLASKEGLQTTSHYTNLGFIFHFYSKIGGTRDRKPMSIPSHRSRVLRNKSCTSSNLDAFNLSVYSGSSCGKFYFVS
ncbi:hypothetical protein ACHWQZ_G014969 [Mnemiopsis leidyi]